MLKKMIALTVMSAAAFAVSAQPAMQTHQGAPAPAASDQVVPATGGMMQTQAGQTQAKHKNESTDKHAKKADKHAKKADDHTKADTSKKVAE